MFSKWMPAAFAVVVAALALATPALADDTQELDVMAWQTAPGKLAETEITVAVPTSVAATAKVTVYAPVGYTADLSAPAGTDLGLAYSAFSEAGTQKDLNGHVVADDPAKYASDVNAQACAPGTHAAVWTLTLGTSADAQVVHVFVDPAAGTDTSFASYVMQVCLASPDVPVAQGGANASAQLVFFDLDLLKTFTNPASTGTFTWRALVTPFVAGTSTESPGGTVEVHSIVALPQVVTLKAKYDPKRHRVTLTGRLTGGGAARPGIRIHLGASITAKGRFAEVGVAVTNKKGAFAIAGTITQTVYFAAFVAFYAGDCAADSVGSASCVLETVAPPPPSAIVKVAVPKKKK